MTEPAQVSRHARFLAELAVALVVSAAALAYVVPRWRGPFKPLEAPQPPPQSDPATARLDGKELAAPGRIRITVKPVQEAMLVVPEKELTEKDRLSHDAVPIEANDSPRPSLNNTLRRRPRSGFKKSLHTQNIFRDQSPLPVLFDKPPIEPGSPALVREKTIEEPDFWEQFNPRLAVAVVAGVFLVVYLLLVRVLRRGPGGRGLSFD